LSNSAAGEKKASSCEYVFYGYVIAATKNNGLTGRWFTRNRVFFIESRVGCETYIVDKVVVAHLKRKV